MGHVTIASIVYKMRRFSLSNLFDLIVSSSTPTAAVQQDKKKRLLSSKKRKLTAPKPKGLSKQKTITDSCSLRISFALEKSETLSVKEKMLNGFAVIALVWNVRAHINLQIP